MFGYCFGATADFLKATHPQRLFDRVITNPPFRLAEEFIGRALSVARHGVAMLTRTVFIESVGRDERLFKTTPSSRFAQFTERVPMVKGALTRRHLPPPAMPVLSGRGISSVTANWLGYRMAAKLWSKRGTIINRRVVILPTADLSSEIEKSFRFDPQVDSSHKVSKPRTIETGKVHMFRVIEPVKISFAISASPAEVRNEIIQIMVARGGRIKVDEGFTILAGFGSNLKVRLLGSWFLGVESMPRDILVEIREGSGQTQVSVVVRDTFGFGSRAGISEKLQKLMYDDALSLKRSFSQAV